MLMSSSIQLRKYHQICMKIYLTPYFTLSNQSIAYINRKKINICIIKSLIPFINIFLSSFYIFAIWMTMTFKHNVLCIIKTLNNVPCKRKCTFCLVLDNERKCNNEEVTIITRQLWYFLSSFLINTLSNYNFLHQITWILSDLRDS